MHPAAIIALLLGAAACGSDTGSAGPDLRPEPRPAPVTLSTDAARYGKGAPGALLVRNDGDEALTHGVCPELQQLEADSWVPVEPPPYTACILLAVVLQPGERYEISFTAPDSPGVYRYVLDFSRSEPSADPAGLRQASNPFTVDS